MQRTKEGRPARVVHGGPEPDKAAAAPSELGELHCCSVADVRLSPASDRIAAHSQIRVCANCRSELGAQVYGAMGISREDTARHAAAVLRNWEFFRAAVGVLFACTGTLGQRTPSV